MTAPLCPHCSAPVRGDGRPACLCAAVDADDFDPLRVRPYVSLPGDAEEDTGDGSGWDGGEGEGAYGGAREVYGGSHTLFASRGDRLDDLPGVDAAVHRADGPLPAEGSVAAEGFAPTEGSVSAEGFAPAGASASPATPGRRRALPAVLAAAGAALAAAAVLITTDALSVGPRDRAAAPDRGTASPSAGLPSGDASTPARGSAAPSRSAVRSPSPGATGIPRPTAGGKRYRSGGAPAPAPTRAAGSVTRSPTPSPGSAVPSAPPTGPLVLRQGAAGPEVTELQERLRQLAFYARPDDGRYGTAVRAAVSRYQRAYGVTGDPDGVYGAPTRASLESRTREPTGAPS
ncbi:Putative peptidoglycan binding domain-containing protein [Streptomyces sp. 2112.3]|uniref:peptidoglycan-binding domain-containing protein n=1 Tax=Streptomyces sp. 2112.3 TaxID=1881023 RepID=UPI000898B632|nr:peptidoglycan-binding domain-containing protein [Streptomyces sp. 2112.3]SEF01021.1 Putative peptidoglycan binding domain-containing protein [Streptomyces sp. 2112.3]